MRKRRSDLVITIVVVSVLILFAVISINRTNMHSKSSASNIFGDNNIGLVSITGVIYDSRSWIKKIEDFRKQDRIKAIVVRIESPGGAVAASQELYEALRRARQVKPVVASFGNVAASGGYYTALGADSVVANPGSTTGSIGVIIEMYEYHELLNNLGISSQVVKSGKFKDSGNPARELTPDEKAYLQSYIDDSFKTFSETVAKERNIPLKKVLEIADGRVFTGRQALELGLVDLLGDQHYAVHIAAKMAGIEGEANVVKAPKRSSDWLELILDEATNRVISNLEAQDVFHYRWKPETVR